MINIKTFVQDDDGHWYCIPYKNYEEFRGDLDTVMIGDEEFNDKWDKYRMDGGVEGIPIVIDWGRV